MRDTSLDNKKADNMYRHGKHGRHTGRHLREDASAKKAQTKAKMKAKITKRLPWKRDTERSRLTEDEARSMQTIHGNKKASQVRKAEIGARAASKIKPARTNVVSR